MAAIVMRYKRDSLELNISSVFTLASLPYIYNFTTLIDTKLASDRLSNVLLFLQKLNDVLKILA